MGLSLDEDLTGGSVGHSDDIQTTTDGRLTNTRDIVDFYNLLAVAFHTLDACGFYQLDLRVQKQILVQIAIAALVGITDDVLARLGDGERQRAQFGTADIA